MPTLHPCKALKTSADSMAGSAERSRAKGTAAWVVAARTALGLGKVVSAQQGPAGTETAQSQQQQGMKVAEAIKAGDATMGAAKRWEEEEARAWGVEAAKAQETEAAKAAEAKAAKAVEAEAAKAGETTAPMTEGVPPAMTEEQTPHVKMGLRRGWCIPSPPTSPSTFGGRGWPTLKSPAVGVRCRLERR